MVRRFLNENRKRWRSKEKKIHLKLFLHIFNFISYTLRNTVNPFWTKRYRVIASVRSEETLVFGQSSYGRYPVETEQYYASSTDNSGRAYQRGAAPVQTITERKTNVTRYASPIPFIDTRIRRYAHSSRTNGHDSGSPYQFSLFRCRLRFYVESRRGEQKSNANPQRVRR